MLQELFKTLEKELELLGGDGSRSSVYTDLGADQVRVADTMSPIHREIMPNSNFYGRSNSVTISA